MLERAHPDAFRNKWVFRLRRGYIPWITRVRNPYREAFFWRYRWVSANANALDVLDVPCGMGWGTSLIQGARTIVGVDIDLPSVKEAAHRYGKYATFHQGDMGDLDFADGSFDLVSCLEGIEHVPMQTARRFLKEAARVLRPNGRLLLSSPYCRDGRHSGNQFHVHEYQTDELLEILSSNFLVEDIISREVDYLTVQYVRCRRRI